MEKYVLAGLDRLFENYTVEYLGTGLNLSGFDLYDEDAQPPKNQLFISIPVMQFYY